MAFHQHFPGRLADTNRKGNLTRRQGDGSRGAAELVRKIVSIYIPRNKRETFGILCDISANCTSLPLNSLVSSFEHLSAFNEACYLTFSVKSSNVYFVKHFADLSRST